MQTTDFFTPIVDDPFAYGQIAAANALSDIFAMGGRPLTALNMIGMPDDIVSPKTIAAILRGGLEKANEVGCAIIGGHTIRNPGTNLWPGRDRNRLAEKNADERQGETGRYSRPDQAARYRNRHHRDQAGSNDSELVGRAIKLMSHLNSVGAELGERGLVCAATDVTGFGLLGHLASLCRASEVSAEINAEAVPAISEEILAQIEKTAFPAARNKT